MPESASQPPNWGLQLFPVPPKKAKINPTRALNEGADRGNGEATREHALRRSEDRMRPEVTRQAEQSESSSCKSSLEQHSDSRHQGRQSPPVETTSPITMPASVPEPRERSQTPYSEPPNPARRSSDSSHPSVQNETLTMPPQHDTPVMRSIFPRYDPDILLEHQPYYPTQASPSHIPRAVINRRPYSPSLNNDCERARTEAQHLTPKQAATSRVPQGLLNDRNVKLSTNDDLKHLWRIANGWKVSPSEGRSFRLRMNSSPEEPVYTLSSESQTFYTLRLDPTSTSAQMMLSRQDPSKPVKEQIFRGSSKKANVGMEVISTTLEEDARRMPPNDGLVAHLYPTAVINMVDEAASRPDLHNKKHLEEAAERECGRLVWDDDSGHYYLVHPALATPFCISIQAYPAWSKTEYTLEHNELPHNIVRLVRDGAGSGVLEVDVAAAAKVDSFYIVDVAICAMMLVAVTEEKLHDLARFEAPPSLPPVSPKSRLSIRFKRESKRIKDVKVEEFELDLESQESMQDKKDKLKKEKKVPGFFGLVWMLVKCLVWTVALVFKAVAKTTVFICRCAFRRS